MTLQKGSFAWSEGGEEGGGAGGGGSNGTVGGTTGTGNTTGTGGLAHWVSVMAEHIHNPHSTTGVGGVHQQQSSPQAPYPWNNGLSSDVSHFLRFFFFLEYFLEKVHTISKKKKVTYFFFIV